MANYKGIIRFINQEDKKTAVVEEIDLITDGSVPVVISNTGTFNLSTNNTLTTLSVGGVAIGSSLNLATGAVSASAVTCAEVVARINEALTNQPAAVVNNRVVITGLLTSDVISIAGNACNTVFGSATINSTGVAHIYNSYTTKTSVLKADFSSKAVGDTIYYHYTDTNDVVLEVE